METFVTVIHIIVAVFLVLVVLVQAGNAGGVGAAFGGGNSSGVFGATGANQFLSRLTYGAAAVFMTTSLALTVMEGRGGKTGLMEKLQNESVPAAPSEPAAEVTTPPAASDKEATQPASTPATSPETPSSGDQK
jgi:preprotein translocase subunit SecG